MTKLSQSMNVTSTDLATYLAAGWTVQSITYSEGADAVDDATLFLMVKAQDSIRVKAASVQAYLAAGYTISEVLYGASQVAVRADFAYLDIPAFSAAEIGTVADTKVAVTFTTEVAASDYATGVTIKVDTVSQTISAAARQTDHKVVHYTIDAVTAGQAVTWEYNGSTGVIVSENDGSQLGTVAAEEVTNNVAGE